MGHRPHGVSVTQQRDTLSFPELPAGVGVEVRPATGPLSFSFPTYTMGDANSTYFLGLW